MGRWLRKRKLKRAVAAAQQTQAAQQQAAQQQAAQQEAQQAAAKEEARLQQLAVNLQVKPEQTTAVAVDEPDNLETYINSMKNRRKKGAPMGNPTGVLGQPTSLGV